MDDADAALARQGDRHARLGDGVHGRGDDRHVERDRRASAASPVETSFGRTRRLGRDEQDVVEREPLLAELLGRREFRRDREPFDVHRPKHPEPVRQTSGPRSSPRRLLAGLRDPEVRAGRIRRRGEGSDRSARRHPHDRVLVRDRVPEVPVRPGDGVEGVRDVHPLEETEDPVGRDPPEVTARVEPQRAVGPGGDGLRRVDALVVELADFPVGGHPPDGVRVDVREPEGAVGTAMMRSRPELVAAEEAADVPVAVDAPDQAGGAGEAFLVEVLVGCREVERDREPPGAVGTGRDLVRFADLGIRVDPNSAVGGDPPERVMAVREPQVVVRPGRQPLRLADPGVGVEAELARCRHPSDRVAVADEPERPSGRRFPGPVEVRVGEVGDDPVGRHPRDLVGPAGEPDRLVRPGGEPAQPVDDGSAVTAERAAGEPVDRIRVVVGEPYRAVVRARDPERRLVDLLARWRHPRS